MRRTALLVASLALLAATGCGSGNETPGVVLSHSAQPISGGQVDSTHTSVVGIAIISNGGFEMCSGTLIAPNLVLTARHCVSQIADTAVICGQSAFGAEYPAGNLYVTTNLQFSYQGSYTKGKTVSVPSQGNDVCGYDIALITLQSNITSTKPYIPRIDKKVSLGEVYTAVGYGITSPTGQDSGERRDRTGLHVSWYNGMSYDPVCGSKPGCGQGLVSSEWQGETGICSGDSGGPALDANGMVIGVTSRGYQCDYPIYSAVSTWKDFIIQGALDAAKSGGYTPAKWVTTGSTSTGTGGAGGAGGATSTGGSAGTGGQATGGAGGAAGGPVTTQVAQGDPCSATNGCPAGYKCVYDSDPKNDYCAAVCDANNTCAAGLQCTAVTKTIQVCKNPPPADNTNTSSGCTVSERGGPAKPVPWVIGLTLVGLALTRRRRS